MEKPPIYKDWNNYPDIKGLDKYQLVSKLAISWDSIEPKGESAKWGFFGTLLGLEWDRTISEYPGLTKKIINIEQAKERYDLVHSYNPKTLLGVEVRWDVLKDYELPEDHKWWKRDENGNRIKYKQSNPPRYMLNIYDKEYLVWIGERCKALFETGVIDFIIFDHIKYQLNHGGDPLPMLKTVREIVGYDAVILGNTHFDILPEVAMYIDAWGEKDDEGKYKPEDVINYWENNYKRNKKLTCWEFIGPKDDLKTMRFYTTLVMTNSDGAVRYIDHGSTTKPSPWYDFWEINIGRYISDKKIINECFAREYTNGTTICNNNQEVKKIIFNELRLRASNGEIGKEFLLEGKDGDMFLFKN